MLEYIIGDATNPVIFETKGPNYLFHIVNNERGWGRGFVNAITRKWGLGARSFYLTQDMTLGGVHFYQLDPNLMLVNLVAQKGYGPPTKKYVCYDSLRKSLKTFWQQSGAESLGEVAIHMPRIGAGLGGGDWSVIEQIIKDELVTNRDTKVIVYDLPY